LRPLSQNGQRPFGFGHKPYVCVVKLHINKGVLIGL
jgi:hypothetical protein